jgi:nucleotide-binding universal stress UspA family protein
MTSDEILVATDGSPAAEAAVEEGITLAAAMNRSVRFVHASSLADDLFEENPEDGPSSEEVLARDGVLRHAAERAAARGVEAQVEVLPQAHTSDLAADIAGLAVGAKASLIVVGSRGRGPVSGALLGSVSHNLIKWATVPVVVVNAPQADETQA